MELKHLFSEPNLRNCYQVYSTVCWKTLSFWFTIPQSIIREIYVYVYLFYGVKFLIIYRPSSPYHPMLKVFLEDLKVRLPYKKFGLYLKIRPRFLDFKIFPRNRAFWEKCCISVIFDFFEVCFFQSHSYMLYYWFQQ